LQRNKNRKKGNRRVVPTAKKGENPHRQSKAKTQKKNPQHSKTQGGANSKKIK
jgi:hypothetical protein